MNETEHWCIGLLGYGEVGRILAEDLRARGAPVRAFDIKLDSGDAARPLREHARLHGVALADAPAELVAHADLVISAVTADQALRAAQSCAAAMPPLAFYLDLNSASPAAKLQAAHCIDTAGGRYVEGAVMTSVPPHRLRVPLLLGGPWAEAVAPALAALGFGAQVFSATPGTASATKMCRSVLVKGLEALVIECLTSARHFGVEDAVLESLYETFPGIDWDKQAAYFFQRVVDHGERRAEEMREAARTVREAGLTPWGAAATAERQAWMAQLKQAGCFAAPGAGVHARSADWRSYADRIIAAGTADRQ